MEYFHKREKIQVRFDMYIYFFKIIKTETEMETETEVGACQGLS